MCPSFSCWSPLFLVVSITLLHSVHAAASPPRVAIIGCGIGGGAASFFMQDLLRNGSASPASITAYERRDYIGGRLKHVIFGTQEAKIEVGGAAWTYSNRFMRELASRMNITTSYTDDGGGAKRGMLNKKLGVWRGDGFAHITAELALHAPSVLKVLAAEKVP